MFAPLLRAAGVSAVLALAAFAGARAQYAPLPGTIVKPPANGVYLGAYVQGEPFSAAIGSLESQIHRTLAIHVSFFGIDNAQNLAGDETIRDDVSKGRISLISLSCGGDRGGSLDAIAAGTNDSQIDRDAAAFRALSPHPMMVRFMWEMNLNVQAQGREANGNGCFRTTGDAAEAAREYVAAQRHLEDRFARDGVRNVTWLWCPAGAPGNIDRIGADNLRAFYPGDRYVDWVCYDAYDRGRGMADTLEPFVRDFASLGKPIIIAETGERAEGGGRRRAPQSQAQYLADLSTAVQPGGALYPSVKAICYFDSTPKRSHIPWTLSPDGISSFRTLAQSQYFQATIRTGAR